MKTIKKINKMASLRDYILDNFRDELVEICGATTEEEYERYMEDKSVEWLVLTINAGF